MNQGLSTSHEIGLADFMLADKMDSVDLNCVLVTRVCVCVCVVSLSVCVCLCSLSVYVCV
jgi:hypothetical protein